jgi:xylan 1,4-beta-xylosidase
MGDHVQMGIARQLASIQAGFKIVSSFNEWRNTPIILGESDPEGCAACSARNNPQNSYRNGPLYATYEAETLFHALALARIEQANLLGSVTWAFEFEDQPIFEGFRELATNAVDKPVLNAFRMFGLLGRERVQVTSSDVLSTEDVGRVGVRARPEINAIAARNDHEIAILLWNYHDDDLPASPSPVDLTIAGLAATTTRGLLEHFRTDSNHSNSFATWKRMGSPQTPSAEQYEELLAAGQLQVLDSPAWIPVEKGAAHLSFTLPRQAVSLVRLRWQ